MQREKGKGKREKNLPRRSQARLAVSRPGRERPVWEAFAGKRLPTVLRTRTPFLSRFASCEKTFQRRFAAFLLFSLFPFPFSLLLAGCGKRTVPGMAAVPVLPAMATGSPAFLDCSPKWSSDGTRIAFLRATPDRKLQLFVADSELKKVTALIQPEIVNPDRPYAPSWKRYTSPDTLAWSPDDRWIAYERSELFDFGDSDRLPGTGLWMLDMTTRKSRPLAIHTRHYTGNLYYYRYPQWAPDGGRVAFVGEGHQRAEGDFYAQFRFFRYAGSSALRSIRGQRLARVESGRRGRAATGVSAGDSPRPDNANNGHPARPANRGAKQRRFAGMVAGETDKNNGTAHRAACLVAGRQTNRLRRHARRAGLHALCHRHYGRKRQKSACQPAGRARLFRARLG